MTRNGKTLVYRGLMALALALACHLLIYNLYFLLHREQEVRPTEQSIYGVTADEVIFPVGTEFMVLTESTSPMESAEAVRRLRASKVVQAINMKTGNRLQWDYLECSTDRFILLVFPREQPAIYSSAELCSFAFTIPTGTTNGGYLSSTMDMSDLRDKVAGNACLVVFLIPERDVVYFVSE